MPPYAISFDVYGTLVDPLGIRDRLRDLAGDRADRLSELWRGKQLEYSFRRAAMGGSAYENFDVCTRQALRFAAQTMGVPISADAEERLLAAYLDLQAFPDVTAGLSALDELGHTLVAFSNGVEASLRTLLARAGCLAHLSDVVSVDPLRTFKPDPAVYHHLAERMGVPPYHAWVVSGNSFDILGAAAAGLRTAWLRRDPAALLDPWGVTPDVTVADLRALPGAIDAFAE